MVVPLANETLAPPDTAVTLPVQVVEALVGFATVTTLGAVGKISVKIELRVIDEAF